MPVKFSDYGTNKIETVDIAQRTAEMAELARSSRRQFERRWYDNNFFDDGFHFRYLSRTTNKIVDLSERSTVYTPKRAIPKASRQIRGVANLLLSGLPTPVVYPEKIERANYPDIEVQDPVTGQIVSQPNPEYEQALKVVKELAKRQGHWIQEEFKNQNILIKLALMLILTAKHSVSYLQIWPDPVHEEIRTNVYDAFDILLIGRLTDIEDSPFIIKETPKLISEIKANENFDQDQVKKINPDNRQASSEIKEAYMNARYGQDERSDTSATLIQREAFIKEYLNSENRKRILKQDDGADILKDKKDGDMVMRQVFSAGNIWLRDQYINLPSYPIVDLRFEPGPIYSVPLIERFIPVNKSLDTVVSRVERYTHTMVTGSWLKKQGEQFKPTNVAGGQIIEYAGTPPIQNQIAPIPAFVFSFINFLGQIIEEQGVTTTALGKVPRGVKAHAAIESLKESEVSSLLIASQQFKYTIKRIAEKFLEIADDYFVRPKTVYYLEKGEPQYFDVIGASAIKKREELHIETPENIVPIKKNVKVEVEITSGLGYTKEGQRATMMELAEYMRSLAQEGYLPPDAVKVVIEKLLETYQFGAVSEFMESLKDFKGQTQMTDQQIKAMKVAFVEVLKDLRDKGIGMPISPEENIEQTKVGVAEAVKDISEATRGGEV